MPDTIARRTWRGCVWLLHLYRVAKPIGGYAFRTALLRFPDATKRRTPLVGCAGVAGEWGARSHPNHTALLRQRALGEREDDMRAGI
jgi:hypothetical protein